MIDWIRIAQLRKDIGEDDFDEVIDIFIDEVEGIIDRLRDAASAGQMAAELHCLKGSASNLGFAEFARTCATMEAEARNGRHEDIDLPRIMRIYEASKAGFLEGLGARPN